MCVCLFVWLVLEKERQGETLHVAVVSLFKREVHFAFIKQNNREQNIKCSSPDVPLDALTAADN